MKQMIFCDLEEGDRFRFRLMAPSAEFRVTYKRDDVIHYTGVGGTYIIPKEYEVGWTAEVTKTN